MHMADKLDLTPDFCLRAVINSTPKPGRWNPQADKPSTKTLFDLGVVDDAASAVFVQAVKKHIAPWQIKDDDVTSDPGTTLQAAANSVQTNAL
jgi:hypothetical protein